MVSTAKKVRLFAYGTLKSDGQLNNVLTDLNSKLLHTDARLGGYDMYEYNNGTFLFPFIMPGQGIITGEIWELWDFQMSHIDRAEGGMFNRQVLQANTSKGRSLVFVYIGKTHVFYADRKPEDYMQLESGTWVNQKAK